MTRRLFFGLIPALLAAAKWPIEKLRPKVRKFKSFLISSPYSSELLFDGIAAAESMPDDFGLIHKIFKITNVRRRQVIMADGSSECLLAITFSPIPEYLHVANLSDAKIRQPWPKNPHRSESEDDAAFPATWLENKIRSEIDHV